MDKSSGCIVPEFPTAGDIQINWWELDITTEAVSLIRLRCFAIDWAYYMRDVAEAIFSGLVFSYTKTAEHGGLFPSRRRVFDNNSLRTSILTSVS